MELRIDGLSAGYDDTTVLRDVSLSVSAGEVVALLGPNGAGKTTLLRAASGLIPARAGRVVVDGESVVAGKHVHELARRGLCHVPEGRSIFADLSVKENLRIFCPRGQEEVGIERAVAAFPVLGKRLGQIAGTMSGGEQQMLALARSYVTARQLVMLDEVSLGLAPVVVDEIFLFLERLAQERTSLLLVEQYVSRALAIADRVYVLVNGGVAFTGPTGALHGHDAFGHYFGEEPAF